MNLIVLTPLRLLGDALASCLAGREGIVLHSVVTDIDGLRIALANLPVEVVLVDVTHGILMDDMRGLAREHPAVALVALGLMDPCEGIVHCGRAGFGGYVARDASIDELCRALLDASAGRLNCSAEVSAGLLRALFSDGGLSESSPKTKPLTRRESEVLHLIGRGLSNKEMARHLNLGIATVKHHVHNLLTKLEVSGRTQAMRLFRDRPWIAPWDASERSAASREVGMDHIAKLGHVHAMNSERASS